MSEQANAVIRQYIQNTNTATTRTGNPISLAEGDCAIVDRRGQIITTGGGANDYTGNANQKEIAIVQKLDGSLEFSPYFNTSDIVNITKEAYHVPHQNVIVVGAYGTVGSNPTFVAGNQYRLSLEFEDVQRSRVNKNPERFFLEQLSTADQAGELSMFQGFIEQINKDLYCDKFCRASLTGNGTFVASTTAGSSGTTTYAFTKGSKNVVVTFGGTPALGNAVVADSWLKISNDPQTNLISGAPVASSPIYKVVSIVNASPIFTIVLDRVYEGETQTITKATTAVATEFTVMLKAAAEHATTGITEFGIRLVGLRQAFGERIGRHIVSMRALLGKDEISRAMRSSADLSATTTIQEADYGAGAWETIFDLERMTMFSNGSRNHNESIVLRPDFRTSKTGEYSIFSLFVNKKTQRALYTEGNSPIALHIAVNAGAGTSFTSGGATTSIVHFNTLLGLIAVEEKLVNDSTAWNETYLNGGVSIAS